MPTSITVDRMRNFAAGTRSALRNNLTLGPYVPLGMWQWSLLDGSTWAAVAFSGTTLREETLLGWAGYSEELDLDGVIGVYVAPTHRGQGLGRRLVTALVTDLMARDVLREGETVNATTSRWPSYYDLLEGLGLVCVEWQ